MAEEEQSNNEENEIDSEFVADEAPQGSGEQQQEEPEAAEQENAGAEAPDSMSRKLEALALELKKAKDAELRAYAEMDNLRKRTEMELAKNRQFALTAFAKDLLDVADNLERAYGSIDHANEDFANIDKGVELTLKSLMKVLEKHGVEQLDPKGQPFDPATQHAIQMLESEEYEANTVIDVMQKGYNLNGRNIRPAMVVVSKVKAKVDTQA